MTLPEYDQRDGGVYTADEMRHVVAREVMKHRLDQLEGNQLQVREDITKIGNDIITSNKMLHHEIQKLYETTSKGQRDLRAEIERDFASKTELIKLESKVDGLATKITIATGAVVLVIQIGMRFVG